MGLSPVIVFIFASLVLYSNKLNEYRPSIIYVKFKYSKDLFRLGASFFLIQIAALILFASGNLVIAQLLGQEDVAKYNIVYKYFSILLMIFTLILTPFWSATTEAFYKTEFQWIMNIMKRLKQIWLILVSVTIVMVFSASTIYKLWIGKDLAIPWTLNLGMGIYLIIITYNQLFVTFINAVGKLRLQLYHSVFIILFNIPLSIFLCKNLNLGLSGIVLSNIFCQGIASIWTPLQYKFLINSSAKGIWNK
jgi:O-antigen/teichoic acid export membrane protein